MSPQSVNSVQFINAHTHLELSGFQKPIAWTGSFPDWIAEVMKHRSDPAYSVEKAVRQGMEELRQTGTVAVGNIVQEPDAVFPDIPGRRFLELIAWNSDRTRKRLETAESFLRHANSAGLSSGLSPHAPYTICPELLEGTVALSRKFKIPLAIHLAETRDELELLHHQSGPMLEMMRRADPDYRPEKTLLGDRPLDYLKLLAEADRAVVIHGNYLDDEEIRFLAAHHEKMSVVFCPVPHRYFGHKRYPLKKMLDLGVHVALGTDSRASWPNGPLSMSQTLRVLLQDYPEIPAATALEMATTNGNVALGIDKTFQDG